MSAAASPNPVRRQRFQFSLRTVLILIFLISLPLGGFAWRLQRARTQRVNIIALENLGGSVTHRAGMDWASDDWYSRCENWAYDCLGKDFFLDVTVAWVKAEDRKQAEQALASLRQFPELESLIIRSDHIRISEVSLLPCLPELRLLAIKGSGGTTDYPPDDLRPLDEAENLYNLVIDKYPMRHETLDVLQKKHRLRRLELSGPHVNDHLLAGLGPLDNLDELTLKQTSITDDGLRHLAGLRQLRILTIENAPIQGRGFAALENLSALRSLDVTSTRFDDEGMPALQTFPSLHVLRCENTLIHGNGIKQLLRSTQLETLDAGNCPITDEALANLRQLPSRLHWLDVSHSQITDASLDSLETGTELSVLSIVGTKTTPARIKQFQAKCPWCFVSH